MHRDRGRPQGFTIVELLTVIAILAILMGLLTSALAGARKTSQKARELNNIRQVGVAWQVYANTNAGAILPGYIDEDVQNAWDVEYEFPSGDPVPPLLAASWTFRLLPFLDNSHDIVHGYEDETDSNPLNWANDPIEAEAIALHPSFGYNAHYIGGWWEMADMGAPLPVPRYRFFDARADLNDDGTVGPGEYASVVSRSAGTIRRTSQLVAFCSSAVMPVDSTYDKVRRDVEGSHWVSPPLLALVMQWHVFDPNKTEAVIEVLGPSPSPIGRYNNNAAVQYADGHNNAVLPGSLADQRSFIDVADRLDWQHE